MIPRVYGWAADPCRVTADGLGVTDSHSAPNIGSCIYSGFTFTPKLASLIVGYYYSYIGDLCFIWLMWENPFSAPYTV